MRKRDGKSDTFAHGRKLVTSLLSVSHRECIQGAPLQGKHNLEGAARNGLGVVLGGRQGAAGNASPSPLDLFTAPVPLFLRTAGVNLGWPRWEASSLRNAEPLKSLIFKINTMFRLVPTLLASILLFTTDSTSAASSSHASPIEALRLFAKCDASLFNALKENSDLLGTGVEVKKRGKAATIAVENPLAEKGRDQVFSEPVVIDGLRFIAWHDEVSYDFEFGGFLFWGFRAEGSLNAVAKKINGMLSTSEKLVDAGNTWARAEIRGIGDPVDSWRPSNAGTGTVTANGSVERVLFLESGADNQTNVFCTLQGSVTPALLQVLRPDLTNAEYPE